MIKLPDMRDFEDRQLLNYFRFDHLVEGPLRDTSAMFSALAHDVIKLPRGGQRSTALRKLLEAKDAAVRAALDIPTE